MKHLVRQSTQLATARYATASPAMQAIARQILHCPYWGITKRIYLESKALELLAVIIAEEVEAQRGRVPLSPLPSEEVDRLHRAREILLRDLHHPPTLMDLAHQVGLNECSLKRGFRQVFGKTTFGYLLDYRLEQAYQLLFERHMNVEEVARKVGYANRRSFATAFRKKFGSSPKAILS
ncbi:helix-turn-helix transcriptional regulator [Myxacorys almedinensis]|uniref:Helix-turn-helix domain-containing protein n=1 Tax=Myxacorys almedinensis A TaxID=2690445 RepID=A0A8J7Z8B8_9CYAN|nr:AraC family transcriptional regulator [Myxacorys almedinensis]NDJ19981.1 helix-turn-helix domain-containing protein [Myxacorys almedinensis A]